MTTPSTLDLPALKALAEQATPGPWTWQKDERCVRADGNDRIMFDRSMDCDDGDKIDGAFIAAANPATVLALLAEVERLREERDTLAVSLTGLTEQAVLAAADIRRLCDGVNALEQQRNKAESALATVTAERDKWVEFVRSVNANWDCDSGAHGTHSPHCRSCEAGELLLSLAEPRKGE